MTDLELSIIREKWNADDSWLSRPGHDSACRDIQLLADEVCRLKRQIRFSAVAARLKAASLSVAEAGSNPTV